MKVICVTDVPVDSLDEAIEFAYVDHAQFFDRASWFGAGVGVTPTAAEQPKAGKVVLGFWNTLGAPGEFPWGFCRVDDRGQWFVMGDHGEVEGYAPLFWVELPDLSAEMGGGAE